VVPVAEACKIREQDSDRKQHSRYDKVLADDESLNNADKPRASQQGSDRIE
jgi:hypothetical protein